MRVLFLPLLGLAWALFLLTMVWGQILNVFDIATGWAVMPQSELLVRIVGLFVLPLGAWFGWF